jgi:hypothetical protein
LFERDIASKRGFDRETETLLNTRSYERFELLIDNFSNFSRDTNIRAAVELGRTLVGIEVGDPEDLERIEC